ncbi:DUF3631 domain-containing protein [Mycobacterium antarcticum]|uniref:DUF3631 domain-containing protein n=1 Tax=unclassified Mycolicibacterium TaxID=2636767 RepID=UPI0024E13789|nr:MULTISPECIES: DUF3631 domain-containing protein [unclassified Mycolicibacterium]
MTERQQLNMESNPPTSTIAPIAPIADMTGVQVLDAVDAFLARFIAYPSDDARHAHTLWLAHTWRMKEWESTPRLAFMSPEKGSGKTRALEVSEHLVPGGVRVSQASTAYIVAKVSADPTPTLFYDEIDTVYGPRAKGNEDLRSVLNAGHRRGATVGRGTWDKGELGAKDYPAYCAVALAGLGKLPDTIADRAVVIPMKKRKPTERVDPWRERVNACQATELAECLESWMAKAEFCWPKNMPVQDRAADVWEALVMVADAAGGHWPARARHAAIVLTSNNGQASAGVQLLSDLRTVFGNVGKLRSADIVAALSKLPEWEHFHSNGTALTALDLSKLLKGYGVSSRDVLVGGKPYKGYTADDLRDAWDRYTPVMSAIPAIPAIVQVSNAQTIADTHKRNNE